MWKRVLPFINVYVLYIYDCNIYFHTNDVCVRLTYQRTLSIDQVK